MSTPLPLRPKNGRNFIVRRQGLKGPLRRQLRAKLYENLYALPFDYSLPFKPAGMYELCLSLECFFVKNNALTIFSQQIMLAYILRRVLLMIPTLFGIMVLNFLIVQAAPGGPIEQIVAKLQGNAVEATARVSGGGGADVSGPNQGLRENNATASAVTSRYKGAQGVDPDLILELEKQFGFDQPLHTRFLKMMGNYLSFDFGKSYFRDQGVMELVVSKMPVSVSLGLWTTLIVYLVSIPLGIRKAVKDGTPFDIWSSAAIIAGYAIPSFLFAVLLIVVFAGGRYLDWFPLRGLVSDNWSDLSWSARITDYFWSHRAAHHRDGDRWLRQPDDAHEKLFSGRD
jgi:ABC-type microcin C transport system permease subunit YejB